MARQFFLEFSWIRCCISRTKFQLFLAREVPQSAPIGSNQLYPNENRNALLIIHARYLFLTKGGFVPSDSTPRGVVIFLVVRCLHLGIEVTAYQPSRVFGFCAVRVCISSSSSTIKTSIKDEISHALKLVLYKAKYVYKTRVL